MTMRVRKALTAGVLAVGLATAAGIGAPAAQAAQADTKTVSASATASSGFITCSDPTPLRIEPNSKATACLSLYNGQLTAFSTVTFTSPTPSLWTNCMITAQLFEIASDGTETSVGQSQTTCLAQATGSGSAAVNFSAPVEAGKAYRAKMGMISSYGQGGIWGYPAQSARVIVLS
jgi:hypothetical protein